MSPRDPSKDLPYSLEGVAGDPLDAMVELTKIAMARAERAEGEAGRLKALIKQVENSARDCDLDPCCPWCATCNAFEPHRPTCPAFTPTGVVK